MPSCVRLVLAVALVLLSSHAGAVHACRAALSDPYALSGGRYEGHVLSGQVLADGKMIERVAHGNCGLSSPTLELSGKLLAAQLNGAIVLLGEVHDNPLHHKLRALLLGQRIGFLPAAVFEQIRADQQQALATFRAMKTAVPASGDLAELKRLLDWEKSGWVKDGYDPLLSAVIGADLPIHAGDPSRETIKKVARQGEAALPEDELTRLGLDKSLPAADHEGLLDQLEQSHCGLMPKTAFGNLAFAQRYRDAHQADAVLKAAQEQGAAILFAGNGHVRKDRGVPYYLKQRAPDRKVVSVMLIEVVEGKTEPEAYVERGPDGQPTADYIVFTPRAERPDPCEEMKQRFGKPKG